MKKDTIKDPFEALDHIALIIRAEWSQPLSAHLEAELQSQLRTL